VEQAIAVIASRRYPLHLLHTHTLPFTATERAIEMLACRADPYHAGDDELAPCLWSAFE
jgi:hypothetical protein